VRKVVLLGLVAAVVAVGVGIALSRGAPAVGGDRKLRVIAAEDVWGSIASQLGGRRVRVASVITSPATDPHDYEPTAADARAMAGAQMLIVNGIGYDTWAEKLIAANPVHGRVVLTVGDVVGIEPGGNPHRWYSPGDVQRVIGEIVRDYTKLDPKGAAYFRRQEATFETHGLSRYTRLLAAIKRRYQGISVGASESIFTPLAQALGLKLVTPPSFLKAVSEGAEPAAGDKSRIDRQIARKEIRVWVYNSQNSTPDVQRITGAAREKGIPVTAITETLTPPSMTFQAWQSRQLARLEAALHEATGR
jgi:zinc/manganese transport system substrate-binding protein